MIKKSFNNDNPTLYVAATPIGNISDSSQRLKEILEKISILLCEDSRVARKLFQKLQIKNKPKFLRYDLVKENKITTDIVKLFDKNKHVALISDAGTPLISDPGYPLVKKLKDKEINVVPIPGAVAYISALVVSGFPSQNYFHGFLPDKKIKRINTLIDLSKITKTLIFYVSCYKVKKTLQDINEVFKNNEIFLAKEITKLHETYYSGTAQEIFNFLPETPKGEYVLIVNNNKGRKQDV